MSPVELDWRLLLVCLRTQLPNGECVVLARLLLPSLDPWGSVLILWCRECFHQIKMSQWLIPSFSGPIASGDNFQRAVESGRVDPKVLSSGTMMKRMGTPEEVAKMMAFLMSDDASYITGGIWSDFSTFMPVADHSLADIAVDGGGHALWGARHSSLLSPIRAKVGMLWLFPTLEEEFLLCHAICEYECYSYILYRWGLQSVWRASQRQFSWQWSKNCKRINQNLNISERITLLHVLWAAELDWVEWGNSNPGQRLGKKGVYPLSVSTFAFSKNAKKEMQLPWIEHEPPPRLTLSLEGWNPEEELEDDSGESYAMLRT